MTASTAARKALIAMLISAAQEHASAAGCTCSPTYRNRPRDGAEGGIALLVTHDPSCPMAPRPEQDEAEVTSMSTERSWDDTHLRQLERLAAAWEETQKATDALLGVDDLPGDVLLAVSDAALKVATALRMLAVLNGAALQLDIDEEEEVAS